MAGFSAEGGLPIITRAEDARTVTSARIPCMSLCLREYIATAWIPAVQVASHHSSIICKRQGAANPDQSCTLYGPVSGILVCTCVAAFSAVALSLL